MGSLYLNYQPTAKETYQSIIKNIKPDKDKFINFTGLGEPLMNFETILNLIKKIKKKYQIQTIVTTCGLIKLFYFTPAYKLEKAGLDEIHISVNAITEKDYISLCKPKFTNAYESLLSFVNDCLNSKIKTKISFVVNYKDITKQADEYLKFAANLGISKNNVIFREYRVI